MINVRNVQRENVFLHIDFWKSFGDFSSLFIFHDNDSVSPGKLFFSYGFFIIKACGLCFKFILENIFSSLASVLILITDKKDFHCYYKDDLNNLNLLKEVVE